VLTIGFGAIAARLVDVQAVSAGRFAVLGRSQRLHEAVLPAPRGSILDRNGSVLAVSVAKPSVWADPQLVRDPAGAAAALSGVLGADEQDLRARLTQAGRFVYLARRVDGEVAVKVKALELEGVSVEEEPTRLMPAGALASSVLGEVGVDHIGLSGLELQFDEDLAGKPGQLVVERDPKGNVIPGGERQRRAPVRGRHLVTTLDRDLQFFTEQALASRIEAAKAKGGIAIVTDPGTGEILAMANMVRGSGGEPPRPAPYNKAVIDVYEPGSVNKVVTMAGAIEEGRITPTDTWAVPDRVTVAGSTFVDAEPHPTTVWTATDILTHSSNAGAIMVGQELGRSGLHRYLTAFGLADDPRLDFPGEASGIVPDLEDWSGTSLATLSIGYGLAVTPLQMLAAYNTIANGGEYVAPTLVKAEIDDKGKERPRPRPDGHRVVSEATARALSGMLAAVVREGTGKPAAIAGYTVAGKTGTARKAVEGGAGYREGAYVATFAGFFPAEAPRLSAIVVLDEPTPYTGAQASAPVFADLARYAVRHFRVPPHPPSPDPDPDPDPAGLAATLGPSSATRP
jgi:cell division protein FtsI (penicillin-binding protein 3)